MGARIRIKRGTADQVQLATLSDYEVIFATDTHECYVYDGAEKRLIGQCMSGPAVNRPQPGVTNRLFFNEDTGALEKDSGSAWVQIAVAATHDHSTNAKGGSIPTSSITNFSENVQDVVGGMVSGNVEVGIDAQYDDSAGKLNFYLGDIDAGSLVE
jgi:hypothetical protein